jgi:hypothetical protein
MQRVKKARNYGLAMQTPVIQAVLERLEKLERQNRKLKRAGVLALLVVGSLVLMGQAAPKSRTVEGEKFVLRDGRGRVRAKLDTDVDSSPALKLSDANGNLRAMLSLDGSGDAGVWLFDAKGKPEVVVGTAGAARWLSFYSAEGRAGVDLWTGGGESSGLTMYRSDSVRVSLADDTTTHGHLEFSQSGEPTRVREWKVYGPTLGLFDPQGYSTQVGTTALMVPSSGETRTTSAASIIVLDKDSKVIWRAP